MAARVSPFGSITKNLAHTDWSPLTKALAAAKPATIPSPVTQALVEQVELLRKQTAGLGRLPMSALGVPSSQAPSPVPIRSGASLIREAVNELTELVPTQSDLLRAL